MKKKSVTVQTESIREIMALREKVEERVLNLPNVIGSMIGAKVKSGEVTPKIGLTIFVAEKVSLGQLGPKERVPRQISINGRSVQTDVLEIRPLRPQSSLFPGVLVISDGSDYGTVSSLCRSPNGFFGLTCAHVIGGKDQNPATPDPVEIWSPVTQGYITVGNSLFAYVGPGGGSEDDFGFADAALFTLDHPELVDRAQSVSVIQAASPNIGEIVQGLGGAHGTRTGVVLGIHQKMGDMLIDVCIQVRNPGTFMGDSGMLWKNSEGQPIAIHAYGEQSSPQKGSSFSAAMLAARAASRLNVEFLNAS